LWILFCGNKGVELWQGMPLGPYSDLDSD
jgi:hypothetical protein